MEDEKNVETDSADGDDLTAEENLGEDQYEITVGDIDSGELEFDVVDDEDEDRDNAIEEELEKENEEEEEVELAVSDSGDLDLDFDVVDDEDPRWLGNWHEIDDIAHTHGAFYDQCTVEVINEDDETIWQTEEPDIESTTIEDPDDQPTGYYFKGWSSEKGHFFSAEFDAEEFDPKKLKFGATNVDCDVVIDTVEYDGETLDNDGGDTRGKSLGQEFYENL